MVNYCNQNSKYYPLRINFAMNKSVLCCFKLRKEDTNQEKEKLPLTKLCGRMFEERKRECVIDLSQGEFVILL